VLPTFNQYMRILVGMGDPVPGLAVTSNYVRVMYALTLGISVGDPVLIRGGRGTGKSYAVSAYALKQSGMSSVLCRVSPATSPRDIQALSSAAEAPSDGSSHGKTGLGIDLGRTLSATMVSTVASMATSMASMSRSMLPSSPSLALTHMDQHGSNGATLVVLDTVDQTNTHAMHALKESIDYIQHPVMLSRCVLDPELEQKALVVQLNPLKEEDFYQVFDALFSPEEILTGDTQEICQSLAHAMVTLRESPAFAGIGLGEAYTLGSNLVLGSNIVSLSLSLGDEEDIDGIVEIDGIEGIEGLDGLEGLGGEEEGERETGSKRLLSDWQCLHRHPEIVAKAAKLAFSAFLRGSETEVQRCMDTLTQALEPCLGADSLAPVSNMGLLLGHLCPGRHPVSISRGPIAREDSESDSDDAVHPISDFVGPTTDSGHFNHRPRFLYVEDMTMDRSLYHWIGQITGLSSSPDQTTLLGSPFTRDRDEEAGRRYRDRKDREIASLLQHQGQWVWGGGSAGTLVSVTPSLPVFNTLCAYAQAWGTAGGDAVPTLAVDTHPGQVHPASVDKDMNILVFGDPSDMDTALAHPFTVMRLTLDDVFTFVTDSLPILAAAACTQARDRLWEFVQSVGERAFCGVVQDTVTEIILEALSAAGTLSTLLTPTGDTDTPNATPGTPVVKQPESDGNQSIVREHKYTPLPLDASAILALFKFPSLPSRGVALATKGLADDIASCEGPVETASLVIARRAMITLLQVLTPEGTIAPRSASSGLTEALQQYYYQHQAHFSIGAVLKDVVLHSLSSSTSTTTPIEEGEDTSLQSLQYWNDVHSSTKGEREIEADAVPWGALVYAPRLSDPTALDTEALRGQLNVNPITRHYFGGPDRDRMSVELLTPDSTMARVHHRLSEASAVLQTTDTDSVAQVHSSILRDTDPHKAGRDAESDTKRFNMVVVLYIPVDSIRTGSVPLCLTPPGWFSTYVTNPFHH
ncbi:hypothetical protein KIPB_004976, partial [Kipferlia bialata]